VNRFVPSIPVTRHLPSEANLIPSNLERADNPNQLLFATILKIALYHQHLAHNFAIATKVEKSHGNHFVYFTFCNISMPYRDWF
jgi:hypothetical protein